MTRRIPALDGLRGLAVLLVCYHHSTLVPAGLTGAGLSYSLLMSGWIGVDLFLVLSGFLITTRLLENVGRPDFFRWFYWNRALRILPAYYTLLLILLALTPVLALDWQGRQYMLLTFTQNVGIRGALEFDVGVALRHLWTISLEEHFYLLWPLAVFALRSPRRLATAAIALSVMAIGLRWLALEHQWLFGYIYTMTPFRIDTILAGALLALAWRSPRIAAGIARCAPAAFVVSASLAVFIAREGRAFRWDSVAMAGVGYDAIALMFVCLVAAALVKDSLAARAFEMPWLRWLGTYSYGIYLWYLPLSESSHGLRQWIHRASGNHPLDFIAGDTAVFGAAIAIAMASYHVIELPFLRMKPRLAG